MSAPSVVLFSLLYLGPPLSAVGVAVQLNYLDVVEMYQRREYGAALERLRELEPGRVTDMLSRWEERAFRPGDEVFQAAAVMHTDFAMWVTDNLQFTLAGYHLSIAKRFVERIQNRQERERFRRDWLLALGYFFQSSIFAHGVSDSFEVAKDYYDEGVKRFRDDPEILLSAGTLYEWAGSLKYGEKRQLKTAEELYRAAIRADPGLAEAHLRYGRVLVKRGRTIEAKEPLAKALAMRDSAYVSYLALLILGGVIEKEGDFATAIEHYREAVALIPEWQAGYVALSHALHMTEQWEESKQVLAETLEAPIDSSEHFDGWMVYELGRTQRLDALWNRMREEVSF